MVFLIPSLAATCGAAGLELNLMLVGFTGGAGETIGEISGYWIWRLGSFHKPAFL